MNEIERQWMAEDGVIDSMVMVIRAGKVYWRGLPCSCPKGGHWEPPYHDLTCDWKLRWMAELEDPSLIPGMKHINEDIRDSDGFLRKSIF